MTAIPFNAVSTVGTEFPYIQKAFEQLHISGDGIFTKRCHRLLEETLGVPKALLTTSCTHALEMSALLLDLKPGDQVIVPSFAFVSVVNAFVLRGVKPIFADIRPDTLNLDEEQLEGLITPKTKAVVVMHYAGVGCEMERILAVAQKHGIAVIEDNAHGLFGRYRGRCLGTFGCLATQSFHATKNFTCGEGGALLINDWRYVDRAEILREKGTNRGQFFRGEVDKYSWVDVGSSYLPSDILAAILYAQLEIRDTIQRRRAELWTRYYDDLQHWANRYGIGLPFVPSQCEQTHHIFYLVMPNMTTRTSLIKHLRQHEIQSVFHYVPLHTSDMGRQFGGFVGQCPVTEHISQRLLRLPLYGALTEADQERVIRAVHDFQFAEVGRAVAAGR